MKVFYCTDLHGIKWKYETILELLRKTKYDLLILGADILIKNVPDTYKQQQSFLIKYIPRFLDQIKIPVIIDFGNDDHESLYDLFKSVVYKYDNVNYSHMNSFKINGITFFGMHYVPDYPFGLKDWCRRDVGRLSDPIQFGDPVISTNNSYTEIDDLDEFFKKHISLGEALNSIPVEDYTNSVLLAHAPPKFVSLDVCIGNKQVGSSAVSYFIDQNQPMLSLHGHIHESHHVTGKSIAKIRDTVCIQPGQLGLKGLVYCEFDLNDIENSYRRLTVKK